MASQCHVQAPQVGAPRHGPAVHLHGKALPAEVADVVAAEVALVNDQSKLEVSPLFPGTMEDYSQYKPRGYYDTDENLARYFKAMMWYGRRNFARKNEDQDRSALLMTLAMDKDTLPLWEEIYTITAFFAGASDDSGYYEYRPIIDKVYGTDVTADKLLTAVIFHDIGITNVGKNHDKFSA